MIRKALPVCLFVCISSVASMAQVVGGSNEKLLKLWEKEKYETVADLAEYKFIPNDRKNAENYLWASMGWYELSFSDDPAVIEYYKDKPLKNALKMAGKFAKYDEGGVLGSQNTEYLTRLKSEGLKNAKELMDDGNVRKATYIYRYLVEAFPEDNGLLFLKGVADALNNNSFDAERNITASMSAMKENISRPDDVLKPALAEGFIRYSKYLSNNQFNDSAMVILNFGRDYLPGEEAIADQLSKMTE